MDKISFEENVLRVYNSISKSFDKTRYYVWNEVKSFLDNVNSGSNLLEVGCGNGKNMLYRSDIIVEGCDICDNFVNICKEKGLNVINGNIQALPYLDNSFDNTICVAVIHHLLSLEERVIAIKELLRVTRGKVYIEVWNSIEENRKNKWNLIDDDNNYLVKWNKEYDRYYHLFTDEEIIKILTMIDGVRIIDNYIIKHNRIIIIEKV